MAADDESETVNPPAIGESHRRVAAFLVGAALLIVVAIALLPFGAPGKQSRHAAGGTPHSPAAKSAAKSGPPPVEAPIVHTTEQPLSEDQDVGMTAWLSVSPLQRAWHISPEGMAPYETILSALDLSPKQLLRLKQLLVERLESANDASELGKENRLGANLTTTAQDEAEAPVEQEMEALVGPRNFAVIQEMVRLTPQLQEIAQFVSPALKDRDTALTAEQTLRLAQVYRDAYVGEPNTPSVDRSAGFDSKVGLGDADRKLFADAASVLDPAQLEGLRSKLWKPIPSEHK